MTIQFPDVSHFNAGVDLTGAPALIAKATQGLSYVDPTYVGFRAWAAAAGVPFCAYHWLDTTDAAAQARHAYAIVGPGTPLMIDDEQVFIAVAHTLAFVAAYRALGGVVHLEYAPHWVWHNSGEPDLRPLAAAGLALVTSNYPPGGYTETGPGWTPYGGLRPQDVAIWQWTDNHRGSDFNAFRGTADQFRALTTTGDEMSLTPLQATQLGNIERYLQALIGNRDAVDISNTVDAHITVPNDLAARLNALTAAGPTAVAPHEHIPGGVAP